jgi:PKD repeat protein
VARFAWDEYDALTASFSDLSYDPDGLVVAWRWDFGDGTSSTQSSPTHVYVAPGSYRVTLTVTDADGQSSATSQVVEVGSH